MSNIEQGIANIELIEQVRMMNGSSAINLSVPFEIVIGVQSSSASPVFGRGFF
jgi:hypothetical protein